MRVDFASEDDILSFKASPEFIILSGTYFLNKIIFSYK